MACASNVGRNGIRTTNVLLISLHVLEELLEAMDIVQLPEDGETDVEIPEEEQQVLAVQTAPSGCKTPR